MDEPITVVCDAISFCRTRKKGTADCWPTIPFGPHALLMNIGEARSSGRTYARVNRGISEIGTSQIN
jgi:hypothetical protein